jgi:signal peptidase I
MQPQQSIPITPPTTNPSGESPQPSDLNNKQNRDGLKSVLSTILILVSAPLLAVLLSSYVFQSYRVDGQSMERTLQNNDRLIIWKFSKTWSDITNKPYIPKRGDIVVFTKAELLEASGQPKKIIKRVIGLPGERVVVKNNRITVYNAENPNGFNPDEDQAFSGNITDSTEGDVDIEVGEGELFVCGDNRSNSLDSRFFGVIKTADVKGNAAYRIAPLGNAQRL